MEAFKAFTAELLNDTVLSRIITISDDQVQQNPKAGSLKETFLLFDYSIRDKNYHISNLEKDYNIVRTIRCIKTPDEEYKVIVQFKFLRDNTI